MNDLTDVPHCTLESIGMDITGEGASPIIKAMEDYLTPFAAAPDGKCLKCDATIAGLFGSFTWGLQSGEGTCSRCGWPARGHHYPKLPDGTNVFSTCVEMVFQYHPDHVTSKDSDE